MEIEYGFPLEDPPVLFRWYSLRDQLLGLSGLQRITNDYFVMTGTGLRGLALRVGLHLQNGSLTRIELLRQSQMPLEDSYHDFQIRLEAEFGLPDVSLPADGGFMFCEWKRGGVSITHSVVERFVLQELVLISPLA